MGEGTLVSSIGAMGRTAVHSEKQLRNMPSLSSFQTEQKTDKNLNVQNTK